MLTKYLHEITFYITVIKNMEKFLFREAFFIILQTEIFRVRRPVYPPKNLNIWNRLIF